MIDVVRLLMKRQHDAFEAVRSGKVVDISTVDSESVPLTRQGDLSLYSMVSLPCCVLCCDLSVLEKDWRSRARGAKAT